MIDVRVLNEDDDRRWICAATGSRRDRLWTSACERTCCWDGVGCWEGGCWDPELGLNELLYLISVRCLTVVKMMIMTTMKPMMKITMINWATWVRESGSEWLLQISLHQPKISVHQVIPKISVQRVIHGDDIDRFPWVALLMLQLQVPDKLGLWQSTPSY